MNRILSLFLLAGFFLFISQPSFGKKPKLKNIEKAINEAYDAFAPTGMAVAILKDGEIVYKDAWGYAHADDKTPVETDYLFNIASCTKAFTAAGICLLVEDGVINLDDLVITHLPEFKLADTYISDHLRVRDLLCHRSGLGTFYGDLLWYGTDYSNEEIMRRMQYLPIVNDFRGQFGYQNNMFMLAGLIIERKTGKSWEAFIQERLFNPLNMTNSRPSNDQLEEGQPIARAHIEGRLQPIFDFNGTKAAASIYSSVEELTHWAEMLVNGGKYKGKQVLKPESVQAMFTPETISTLGDELRGRGTNFQAYGLGWRLFDYGGKLVAEHDGGMPGYISKVAVVPQEKLAVIILNNGMDFMINDVIRYYVLDEYLQMEPMDWTKIYTGYMAGYTNYVASAKKARLDSRELDTSTSEPYVSYCGTFEDQMYGQAEVKLDEGELYIKLLPTPGLFEGKMTHWHHDSFKVQFDDEFLPFALINFEVTAEGEVSGFKIDLPNPDFHFFNLHFKSLE